MQNNGKGIEAALLLAVLAAMLGGCGSFVSTKLPDSTQTLKPVMSPEDEKKAVDELKREKDARQSEAIKAIEARQ